jgi:hypothetical protein
MQTEGGDWTTLEKHEARSAEAAVRAACGPVSELTGDVVLVAIPVRSWRPVKVSAKVERTLIVEDAA